MEPPQNLHLLVVEDDEMNQFIVQELLLRSGYTSDLAVDGAQAVEAARNHNYHAILMDVQMPVMDGLTAARRIREWEAISQTARVPIIALTGDTENEQVARCLAAGMDACMAKPIEMSVLAVLLERVIARGKVA